MKGPPASSTPLAGNDPIRRDGFSYLPRFVNSADVAKWVDTFAALHPIWESRHADGARRGRGAGRLTRPVYWLGAWQFAALGYYSEPDHIHDKCVRAEPLPELFVDLLRRLRPELERHGDTSLPNTCLINIYGQTPKAPGKPPVDRARLRMHRDTEPGPVVMLSIGQPAQFEFVEPDGDTPVHSQWVRNRSVVILSGPEYKERLYHRVTRVRYGDEPALTTQLPDFDVRRVSISFRHVPEDRIHDLGALGPDARAIALPYVRTLSEDVPHWRQQLSTVEG